MSGVRFQRGNYVVADLERALTFYRDVLGFKVEFIQPPNPDSYSFPVFEIPRSATTRFCVLSAATQGREMALTEITGITLSPVPHPRCSAIVLAVDDFDTVMAGARALSLTVYDEEHLVTEDGGRRREAGIVDFDDNLVVVYKIMGTTQCTNRNGRHPARRGRWWRCSPLPTFCPSSTATYSDYLSNRSKPTLV